MKIPNEMDQFRIDLEEAVKEIAENYDIIINFKTMRYEPDGSSFTCSTEFKNKSVDGKDIMQVEFEKHCRKFGFEPKDYNAQIKLQGELYYLVGFKPRARTKPCIIKLVEDSSDNQWVIGADLFKSAYKRQNPK